MSKNKWWQPPRKLEKIESYRKISWLELFYDLVYVACIGQITGHIATHPDGKTLCMAALLFGFIYWSWINGTQYYDLHGNETVRTRWFVFLQMLAIGAVAISIPAAFQGRATEFTVSFLIIQGLIIYLLGSISFYDRSYIKLSSPFLLCYSIAFLLLLGSLFCPLPAILPLHLLAVLINLSAPVISARYLKKVLNKRGQSFIASPALIERFGQFTIIVLAESILSTVSGLSSVGHKTLPVWFAFVLAISIAFLLWSIYFDMTNEQELKGGYPTFQIFVFAHLVLLGALGVFSACLKDLIAYPALPAPLMLSRMMLMSLIMFLIAMCMIGYLVDADDLQTRNYLRQVIRCNQVVVLLLIGLLVISKTWPIARLLPTVFLLLAIPVVFGIITWLKHDHSKHPAD